ncbi:MAG: ribosome maturation factor RimM [Acidobacteriota bacterium]
MEELVAIARIVRPRALRGEVVAEMLTDFPDRFERLKEVIAVFPDGTRAGLKIEEHWFQKQRIILKFAGYDSIESVEPLREAEICISEADAVELGDGEYFDWQLSGCRVTTVDGSDIGEVSGIMRTGGTELLSVTGPEKEFLIPFAESICLEVDIEKKRIVIDPPEGLLEF